MAKRQDVKMVWTHGKKGSDDAFFVRASVFMVEQGFQVEFDDTERLFSMPGDKRTEDYITGRFG